MPARQPFTVLCQTAARSRVAGRADLHIHTTASDGVYTPAQVVDLGRRSGLAGLAITDHDTTAGIGPAQAAAAGSGLEIVPGVEITAVFREREFHLLGYWFRLDSTELHAALARLQEARRARFWGMVERLRGCGVTLEERQLRTQAATAALGRRHLAELLIRGRWAGSIREAFTRYLAEGGRVALPKLKLPLPEALACVRQAGGVASWAHPSYDEARTHLPELRQLGLQAVEVEYPTRRASHVRQLRAWAIDLGLAVTGGSDCHGPGQPARAIGAATVSAEELHALRQLASC